jgi:hypothetical protein
VALENGNQIYVDVKAVPWKGIDESFMGSGWSISGNDIILWGACASIIILTCAVCMCFYVRITINKENTLFKKHTENKNGRG